LREETYYVLAYQVPLTISFPVTLSSQRFGAAKVKSFFYPTTLSRFFLDFIYSEALVYLDLFMSNKKLQEEFPADSKD